MKIANFSKLLLLASVLSFGVTGCKSPQKPITSIPNGPKPVIRQGPENEGPIDTNTRRLSPDETAKANAIPPNPDGTIGTTERPDISKYDQDRETFKQQTVYFEFDRYNVRPGELPKLETVATYLKSNPSEKVLVEGHCDERGTPGYNMALGERRALSARESLVNLGVGADRIQTISYGKERPADPGHNEAAWSKNRRAEFILLKLKSAATTASGQ